MKQLLDLRGIITVLNTPFRPDTTPDLDGLKRNVRYAIDAGVAGFLFPAMASEVGLLSSDERRQTVLSVLEAAERRVPVIGGASAATQEERLRAASDLIEFGCDGVLVSIPFETEETYQRDIDAIAAMSPPFLMIQDWDSAGDGLPIPLIVNLFETVECFRCLKVETARAGLKYTEVLKATGGRLHVSGGWAVTQMIEGLDRGVHAFMPTGLHRTYCRIYRAYATGDREAARALFYRLAPILSFSNQNLDLSIRFFKRLLHAQGVYSTDLVRTTGSLLDSFQDRCASDLVDLAIQLEGNVA